MTQESSREEEQLADAVMAQRSNSVAPNPAPVNDYFVEKDGQRFAGIHLLIDLWEAKHLTDKKIVEQALRNAASSANATPLHLHLCKFSKNGGISGVLVLAESHISIHTWPERSFAALDIFMCGSCNPYNCIAALKEAFETENVILFERRRGFHP